MLRGQGRVLKISTKGYYAVRALLDVACQGKGGPVPLSNIAARQDISRHYLEQLFMKLRKSRLVTSVRGPSGGYLLARAPEEISIGDIFRAVDESTSLFSCVETRDGVEPSCNKIDRCVSRLLWARLTENISRTFDSINLKTLRREHEKMTGRGGPAAGPRTRSTHEQEKNP